MTWPCRLFFALLLPGLLALAGCSRPPDKPNVQVEPKSRHAPTAVFRTVLDSFRYPENPRPSDDWTRFREGLQQLSDYFARPEVIARLRLADADRKFLQDETHLSEAELVEVEATSFRPPDAHYLDECFLLRDAARFLEVAGLPPVEQMQRHFGWVMRNVYLHEQGGNWTPPAFVLRRGFGNAVERGMVFLALLRQSHIDGCFVVVPPSPPAPLPQGGEGSRLLVAALDAKTNRLHLFDPRLGTPLPGKDGKSIATVQEALDDPKLLELALITPADAKKLQAWLACPLEALSPRMLELQKNLSAHEVVTLYQPPLQLRQKIAGATKLPIQVWNAPVKDKPVNSPTRCLRMFLPKTEGGLDETGRAQAFTLSYLPVVQIAVNYARIKMNPPAISLDDAVRLQNLTFELLNCYAVQTRELYLRGLYEPVLRRQDRLQEFARKDSLVGLADDPMFRKESILWREGLRTARNMLTIDPTDANAQQMMQAAWRLDPLLHWLLNPDTEGKLPRRDEKDPRKDERSMVTGILAVGLRDYFDLELARAQASLHHEKAELAQAQLRAKTKPTRSARDKAQEAWQMAKSSWANFYLDRLALEDILQQRLKLVGPKGGELQLGVFEKVGLCEQLHREVHEYFEARLRLAECLEHVEGTKKAQEQRRGTVAELEELLKKGALPEVIKELRPLVDRVPEPQRAILQRRLDALAQDWGEQGHWFWLKRSLSI